MNQIQQLLSKLCPDGVPVELIGNLIDYEQPTKYLVSSKTYDDSFLTPVLTAGQTFLLGYTNEEDGKYPASPQSPVIIFDDFTTSYKWVDFEFKVKSSAMKMLTVKQGAPISLRYFWYALSTIHIDTSEHARYWISKFSTTEIPLPPVKIQAEIVRILDQFTELEAQLEAELEVRKSQYAHYRNHLLSFQGVEPGEVRWIPLGDVCEYRKERSKSSTGNFLYVGVEDLLQERRGVSDQARFVSSTGHDIFMPGDVLLGNIRPYLKKVWRADVEGRSNGDVLVVTPRREAITELDTSYLYFLLSSDDFFSYCVQTSKGAKMPRGDKKAILRYEIPVPDIEVQKQIAKSLALFEQLTQDMESGIPAEQAARRKQYEYYRDKLLTFNEMEVA